MELKFGLPGISRRRQAADGRRRNAQRRCLTLIIALSALAGTCGGADQLKALAAPAPLRTPSLTTQEAISERHASASPAAISFRPTPWDRPAARPLRHIDLISGDRITAEILSGTQAALDVRWLGHIRFRIPHAAINRIANLPGEQEILSESFGDGVQVVSADSGVLRRELPALSGDYCYSLRFRVRPTIAPPGEAVEWTARFRDEQRLSVRRHPGGIWRISGSVPQHATNQAVPESAGWHVLRWQQTAGRVFLSLDGALLSVASSPAATPSSCEIRVESHDRRTRSAVLIDHVSIVARGLSPVDLPDRQPAAAVVGSTGDVWWGRLEVLDSESVAWQDAGTRWRLPWRELHGVVMGEPSESVPGRQLTGTIVSLTLQPLSNRLDLPGDRLIVALGGNRDSLLAVNHPLLGRLMVPVAAIQRVEHRHTGVFRLLDARNIPLGRKWASGPSPPPGGQFSLETIPANGIEFAVEVSGLEPAGPSTPPGSPTLKSLRSGRLVTELFVNDLRIGSFNELISDWSLPGSFDRLRLRIPADRLRPGLNTWRIAQQPGDGPRSNHDECRMRNLAWESDVSP